MGQEAVTSLFTCARLRIESTLSRGTRTILKQVNILRGKGCFSYYIFIEHWCAIDPMVQTLPPSHQSPTTFHLA